MQSLRFLIEKSFYNEYEEWEHYFDTWRRVYAWPYGTPTNEKFRRAILARLDWMEKRNGFLLPGEFSQIIRYSIQDLQSPCGSSHNYFLISDSSAFAEFFADI